MRSDVTRGRAGRRLGVAGLALALAVVVVGCGGKHSGAAGTPGTSGTSAAQGANAVGVSDPVSWYGYGPTPDPNISYQSDVVMIGGGPKAIRSGSSDGLTWTLDGSAKGVSDLQPGKVMFASAKAAGRVVAVQHVGPDVAVTVAPVSLTDVVKDGHLKLDQPIDLADMLYQQLPDEPGAYTDLKPAAASSADPSATDSPSDTASTDDSSGDSTDEPTGTASDAPTDTASDAPTDTATGDSTDDTATATDAAAADGTPVIKLPPLDLAAAVAASGKLPPPGPSIKTNPGEGAAVSVGNFEVSPYRDGKNLGFTATYTGGFTGGGGINKEPYGGAATGLKLTLDCSLDMSQASVHADVPISGGKVSPAAQMWISGIKAIKVKIAAGSANGLADNKKERIQLPIDLGSELVPIGGFPTTLALKMTFIADTGFSAKNSTMSASASIPLSGNVGFNGTQGSAPSASPGSSLIDSLVGTSVGINGLVFAVNFKASWGLGFAQAMAGPYASLTFSTGLTVGSDIGMLKCKSVTYSVTVTGGVGLSVSSDAVESIKNAISKAVGPTAGTVLGKSVNLGASKDLVTVTALNKTDYYPKVNGCNPG